VHAKQVSNWPKAPTHSGRERHRGERRREEERGEERRKPLDACSLTPKGVKAKRSSTVKPPG